MRRANAPVSREADTPKDAAGTEVGLKLVLGFLVLSVLVLLAAAGATAYTEDHTTIRGTVVARWIIPMNVMLVTGTRGPRSITAPERHVLDLRADGESAVLTYDVHVRFWNEARPQEHVRRESGLWRVDTKR